MTHTWQGFRMQEAKKKTKEILEAEAGPKYGRRRFPLTLFAADHDLLQF